MLLRYLYLSVYIVNASNFAPHPNIAFFFFQKGLPTSKVFEQRSKRNGSLRKSLELQIWFYLFL
jgi:hypothetical protein